MAEVDETRLTPTPLPFQDPRRYTSTPGFVNHTPRDFEIKAARTILSSHPAMANMSFAKVSAAASFAQVEQRHPSTSIPAPDFDSLRSLRSHDIMDEASFSTPLVERSKLLQPRDAKGSPGHSAVDVAYFLRQTSPPQVDLSDLESPTRGPSSHKLRQVLKLATTRSPASSMRSRTVDSPKSKNIVEKISKDGTRYFQIVLDHPYQPDAAVNELADDEQSDLDLQAQAKHAQRLSQRSSQQKVQQLRTSYEELKSSSEESRNHSELSGSREGSEYIGTATEYVLASHNTHSISAPEAVADQHGDVHTGYEHCPSLDNAAMSIYRVVQPMVIASDRYSGPLLPSTTFDPNGMNNRHDTKHTESGSDDLSKLSQRGPTSAAPVGPLPPLPESRAFNFHALPPNATQVMCQNGRPVPLDNTEYSSNQGLRRTTRDQSSPGGLYSFPALPSLIPERTHSLNAISGSNVPISDAQVLPLRIWPAQQGQNPLSTHAARPPSKLRLYPSIQASNPPARALSRADKTRARKLRDLQQGWDSVDDAVNPSPEESNLSTGRPSVSGQKDVSLQVDADAAESTGMDKPSGNELSKPESAPAPVEGTKASPRTPPRSTVTSMQDGITVRESFPFPLPPHYSPVGTPSIRAPPIEAHPAFRSRSPTPPESPTKRYENHHQPPSIPSTCRSSALSARERLTAAPISRNRAQSPCTRDVTELEARLQKLERENILLNAALRAVLQTAGKVNGCPCGGKGNRAHASRRSNDMKRDSEVSNGTSVSKASNEMGALDLYLRTRGRLSNAVTA